MEPAAKRSAPLDIAKGIAIVCVVLIHSALFVPSFVHTHFIARAVPMFFVMFGITSTLWWSGEESARNAWTWYRTRFSRLLPPLWIAALLWWLGQLALATKPVGPEALAYAAVGFVPWLQTTWFVTAILMIVLAFPALRAAVRIIGLAPSLVASFAILTLSHLYFLQVNLWMTAILPHPEVAHGFYPFWIFAPQYLWLVVAGMALAASPARASPLALAGSICVVALSTRVPVWAPETSDAIRITAAFADVPLCLLLLTVSALLVRFQTLTVVLSWLGKHSWEIYLGHVTVHHLVESAGYLQTAWASYPVQYTALLLFAGVTFAYALDLARVGRHGHAPREAYSIPAT